MKRTMLMAGLALLTGACASDGAFKDLPIPSGPCGTVSGFTLTLIRYGDSTMRVIPVSEIRSNSEWRFKLMPKRNPGDPADYENVNVRIVGKPPSGGDIGDPGPNQWIDVSGTESGSSSGTLVECVPAAAAIGETYEYLVIVDSVGTLDPRAKVIEQ